MDHAGEELERSAKLLHRAVARAHDQAREIGIMQSQVSFYVDMQGKGKGPLPLHSIPKTKNKSSKVVYTEDLTHPFSGSGFHSNRCFLVPLRTLCLINFAGGSQHFREGW